MNRNHNMSVRLLAAISGCLFAAIATAVPSVKIGTAALISPTTADSTYGSATTSTNTTGATRPNEIIELARALGNNPDAIYDFVRNNIDITWMYGLHKGALGALVDRSGTSFDQAHLMVELLRQAGYTASYKAGTITLAASDFTAWTGITNGRAACQLLSSGGIPATVNGLTSTACTGLSSTSTISSVTLSHIWVEVTIPGSSCPGNVCQFDPSYKPYTFKTGRNLISDAGLVGGQTLNSATSGYTNTTDAATGVTYVRLLNTTSLASRLTTYSDSLQTAINTNVPAGEPEDLVGGQKITRYDPPAGQPGLRQGSIPFSPAVQHTWTGNIPDQYRTSLHVQVTRGSFDASGFTQRIDDTVFADEIGGRMLVLDSTWGTTESGSGSTYHCNAPSTMNLDLFNEDGSGLTLKSYTESQNSAACNPRYLNGSITLTVDHPYVAAANGTVTLLRDYMDASTVKRVWYPTPVVIMHGFGDIGRGAVDKWANVQDHITSKVFPPGCEACTMGWRTSDGFGRRMQLDAGWLAQTSIAARLHAQIASSTYALHHAIGVVTGDAEVPFTRRLLGGSTYVYTYEVNESFDRIDVEMGFSLTNKIASTNTRRGAVHAIAATVDALEGSVVGQHQDLPDTVSTATRFDWANAPPATEDQSPVPGAAKRFYQFDSTNYSQAVNLTNVEGIKTTSNDGVSTATVVELDQGEITKRVGALNTAISTYAQAGFTVIAAEDSFLGPGQRGGAMVPVTSPPNSYRHNFSKQRGGALIATRYDANGDPVEIAHVAVSGGSIGEVVSIKGGGGGTQPQQQSLYDPATAADILKSRFKDRSNMLGVDLIGGAVTYKSPVSLSVGTGGFPYELAANLIWRNGASTSEVFGPISHTAPLVPWTTNWNNNLGVSSSAMEVMGEGDVRAMAGTVAAFLAMQDVYKQTKSKQREVAADMVAAWWVKSLAGNMVTTSVGADTHQFVRLYNGTWLSPGAGAVSTLTQTGQRTIVAVPGCGSNMYPTTRGWDYGSVTFAVTNPNGDVQNFAPWTASVQDISGTTCADQKGLRMSSWSFPQGMTVNLVYSQPVATLSPLLTEVNNTLGRKLKFNYDPNSGALTSINNALTSTDLRAISVSDDGTTATHTDAAGAVTKIKYGGVNGRALISDIYDADDSATAPSVHYTYDALQRVMEVRDAGNLQGYDARGPYQYFLGNGVRAERRDPLGGKYTVFYNLDRRPMAVLDELGRQTSISYDGRGRVTEYNYPENDKEQFQYDDRNNTTQFTKVPKPCTPQPCTPPASLTVQASWNPTWNKPDYIINARGFRTDFTYYSSGNGKSLLQQAQRPGAIGAAPLGTSARPTYSFTYNTYGQVLDSTDPTGLITRNVYSTTVSTLYSTALDPTGINAVTIFGYDANGNNLNVTDSRNYVTEFVYDADRRKTYTYHHDGALTANIIAAERSTYDVLGQLRKQEGGTAFSGTTVTAWQTIKDTTYTPTGQISTESDNAGDLITYQYDFMDRANIVIDGVGRRMAMVYDAVGQSTCTWRAWNSTTAPNSCAYDPTSYVANAPIRYAQYAYSLNGLQKTVEDANNNMTTYVYDAFDRLAQVQLPAITKGAAQSNTNDYEQYTYDENGDRLTLRKRDGSVISFGYDNLDRRTLKDIPNSTTLDVYSDYDLAGRPLYARFGSTTGQGIDYGYDSAKRLQTVTSYGRTLTYGYDAVGNRTKLTYPDSNFIAYDYDALNRMWKIRENGATSGAGVLATITWDPLSRRDVSTRGNGTVTDYGYDAASRLNSLTQDLTSTVNDLTRGFTFNGAGQIRTRVSTGAAYDWNAPLSNKDYVPDGLNRYSSVSSVTFAYDANGNLTSDGTRTFQYDVENRLTRVTNAGVQTDLTYDPSGRLYSTVTGSATTQFLYDGDRLMAEYDGSSALQRRYVHGPSVDEPVVWYEGANFTTSPDRRWLHADERGSIIATSDGGGNGTVYAYGPYGEPAGPGGASANWSGSRFRYTGQIALPEPQLYYYKARVYDPALGRFLQTDPIGQESDLNLYKYAGDEPIGTIDPTGLVELNLHTQSAPQNFDFYGFASQFETRYFDIAAHGNGGVWDPRGQAAGKGRYISPMEVYKDMVAAKYHNGDTALLTACLISPVYAARLANLMKGPLIFQQEFSQHQLVRNGSGQVTGLTVFGNTSRNAKGSNQMFSVATPNDDGTVRISSAGFSTITVNLESGKASFTVDKIGTRIPEKHTFCVDAVKCGSK
jgi:RHS repeat-associated protein